MKRASLLLCTLLVLLLLCFLSPEECYGQGTKIITLANVDPTCLDTSKHTVDFWLLSARVPRDSNFFNTTNAIGAKVVVTLTGQGQKPSFPIARQVSTSDLSKQSKIERVTLRMEVLSQYDLWNDTNASAPVETTNLDFPVSFVRTQGKSAAVQVMNALISFTQSSNSLIPPNPYTQGAALVGQLTNSLGDIFRNNKDVDAPDFQLSFSTSHSSACNAQDLHKGIGAYIRDYNGGTPDKGFINISDVDKYCFYKQGDDSDPDIVFISKTGATCSKDFPTSGTNTLANPLFIWAANVTCKTNNGCVQQPPTPSRISAIAAKVTDSAKLKALLEYRLGKDSAEKLTNILTGSNMNAESSLNSKEVDVLHSLSTCTSVGIAPERCLSVKP